MQLWFFIKYNPIYNFFFLDRPVPSQSPQSIHPLFWYTARAFAVRDLIKKEKRDAKSIIAKGIGSDELLYDNLIPEGRFYCRTVRVQVSMPLRKQGIK